MKYNNAVAAMRPARLALAAAAVMGPTLAAAQAQDTNSAAQLEPVVVTAARLEQRLSETIPHTTVLTREDIERSQLADLPSLLAREAGLQFVSNGGPGTATSIFMRGAPSSQVLVMIDGVPITKQDATGAVAIEQLALDQIDRVEIVRGNVSALYGSGAIGGVVQVFTRRGTGAPRAAASVEGGSRGTARASASVTGKSGDTGFSLAASHFETRGYSAINPAYYPSANPDADGYRNDSLSGYLSQEIARGQTLGAQFLASDGKTDYDSAFATPVDQQTSRTKLATARVFSDNRLTDAWTSKLGLTEESDEYRGHETGAFGSDSRFRTRATGLQWNNTVQLTPDWRGTAGLEHQRQRIDSDDGFGSTYTHARDVDAVQAGAAGAFDAHSLQLNVRYDRVQDSGNATTGYLGYGYALTGEWKLIATLSSAFNAPPLGYLYAPGFGNPSLDPERAKSGEVGGQWTSGAHMLRATYFESRVRDELQFDLQANRFENVGRTRNHGVELTYEARLPSTDLRASLTSQDPRNDITDERLLRRSKLLASASVSQRLGAGEFGAAWRYAGSRPDVYTDVATFASVNTTLPAYSLLDLTAQWRFTRAVSLFGRIDNVFDKHYQGAYGYDQPARGVFVGLRVSGLI
ncbi:MAG TPA: TonB-dependent receptor [Burkholderiaceae bacterium]|nr:TonB-dependent receptor [Burkholderiaceae bacterium]